MQRILYLLLILIPAVPVWAQQDLKQIYDIAVTSDPLLQSAQAQSRAATEVKNQSFGTLLPRVDVSATYDRNNRDVADSGTSTFGEVAENYNSEAYSLRLNQPIYRKALLEGYQQGKIGERIGQTQYESAKQDLIIRVMTRYFDVLAAQDSLEFARAEKSAVGRQLEQMQKRFDVGLIAITDVQESQARYDLTVAQEIQAENRLRQAFEALEELTGKRHEQLHPLGNDMPLEEPEPADIEHWVESALENNLDVQIAQLNLNNAKNEIQRQRAGYHPTLDLVGNYTHLKDDGSPFLQETDSYSVGVQLGINLYEGGQTRARIGEAQQRFIQAQEDYERASRSIRRETRGAYLNVKATISQVNALKQALASTETALKATQAGFEVGTRTSVDILDAQRELFRARRDYAGGRYDYILNLMRLRRAAGTLAPEDVNMVNQWLVLPEGDSGL